LKQRYIFRKELFTVDDLCVVKTLALQKEGDCFNKVWFLFNDSISIAFYMVEQGAA